MSRQTEAGNTGQRGAKRILLQFGQSCESSRHVLVGERIDELVEGGAGSRLGHGSSIAECRGAGKGEDTFV
jgi:hypothetical protein